MKRFLAIGALIATLAACSDGGATDETSLTSEASPPQTLYIVGSGTSVGNELTDSLRQAWPRVLYGEAFPRSTILVNGATGPSTVARALSEQLPLARELHPETIAIWLGSYDLNQRTPVDEFDVRLHGLLDGLIETGARSVLIANLPSLPAFDETLRREYNRTIEIAARATGADLVDIDDLMIEPVDDDATYQPDAAGHRAIADAFARALERTDS